MNFLSKAAQLKEGAPGAPAQHLPPPHTHTSPPGNGLQAVLLPHPQSQTCSECDAGNLLTPNPCAHTLGPLWVSLQADPSSSMSPQVSLHPPFLMFPKRDSTRMGSLFHTGTVLYISRGLSCLLKKKKKTEHSDDYLVIEPMNVKTSSFWPCTPAEGAGPALITLTPRPS